MGRRRHVRFDPYDRARPTMGGQGRCRNRSCGIAVWHRTLEENGGLCPACHDARRIRAVHRSMEAAEDFEEGKT